MSNEKIIRPEWIPSAYRDEGDDDQKLTKSKRDNSVPSEDKRLEKGAYKHRIALVKRHR